MQTLESEAQKMAELTPYTPERTERSEENSCGADSFAKPR